MKPASLFLACLLSSACGGLADDDGASGKADGRECKNGRADAAAFGAIGQPVAIVEAANNAELDALAAILGARATRALGEARRERRFESIVELACVPGIGEAALRELELFAATECGGSDRGGVASQRATARECFHSAPACGDGEPSACEAPFFEERYVRDRGDGLDRFPALPLEIRFIGGGYELITSSVLRDFGAVSRSERNHLGGRWSFATLEPDEPDGELAAYQLEFSTEGDQLILTAIDGPRSSREELPIFTLEDNELLFCDELGGVCRPEPPSGDDGPCFGDREVVTPDCGTSGLFACCLPD